MEKESTASFLDKTDWRKTIHRKLESCIDASGQYWYPFRLDSLIDAVSAEYPGFDAESEITKVYDILNVKYNTAWDRWLEINATKSKWQKRKYRKFLHYHFCHDMFEFIKNLCAKKRMLLWGTKKTKGGEQIIVSENED